MNASGPVVRELFRSIQRDDPSRTIDQLGSLVAAFQYRKLYDLTARLLVSGSHVLDWGCGRGHFTYFLVKAGFRVTAYSLEHEPEIFASLSSTEHERLAFVRGTDAGSRRLPFEAGQFAAVFSVGVLEHVRETGGDEPSSLVEIRRVLARDGLFVCYHLPNRYSYIEALSRWLKKPGSGSEHEAFHEHRFTERAIRRLCVEAQLSVSEVRRYGFVPRNSFNRLPRRLRDSPGFASLVNLGDAALERLFSPLDQNYYFLARPTKHTMDSKGLA